MMCQQKEFTSLPPHLLSLRGSEPDLPACAVAPVAPAAFSCCFLCSSNEAKSVFNADRSACSFVICNQRKLWGTEHTGREVTLHMGEA